MISPTKTLIHHFEMGDFVAGSPAYVPRRLSSKGASECSPSEWVLSARTTICTAAAETKTAASAI